jgi:hypothetical protein
MLIPNSTKQLKAVQKPQPNAHQGAICQFDVFQEIAEIDLIDSGVRVPAPL